MTPDDFLPRKGRVGETPADIAQHIAIFLDGVKQRFVIAYDCVEGCVERYKRVGGDFVLIGDEVAVETVHGAVTVEWRK